ALLAALPGQAAAAPLIGSRPNIVFMLADDMGWNQPGFNGGRKGLTPNIDKLAGESLKLTQFYTHSVCAPTRAAFLTGRYAFRTWSDWRSEDFGKPSYLKALGLTLAHNERGEPTRRIHALDTRERTIAEALREAGYFTALVGKWHLGEWLDEHLPMGQGFMHQYGHYAWGIDYYTKTIVHNAPARFAVYDWHRNQQPLREEGYATDLFAAEAARVIAKQTREKPFFLYVPFNAVHGPLNPPPGFSGNKNDPLAIRDAMLRNLDDAVGRIVKAVDKHGFRDNTLVIFTNDNGPVLEEMSTPWRGTKNTTFEGGVRVPCLLRWPGHTEPGTANNGMMFIADWYSTFITLAGGKHEQERKVDALDMTSMLFQNKPSPRNEIVFEVEGSVRLPTLRSGDWKLMGDMLYNLEADPGERTDLAARNPEVVKRLEARLAKVGAERPPLGDKPLLMDPPLPYIYGLKENREPPKWLVDHVEKVRATQPKEWAPGETPWPQAPKGAFASQQP
ncbi:MAG: sulfatase-like hydrolase/transferase, partial [Akkermansiaceae bacterium]|nr:sulfatase-like hydrolase/transferase [Akkermansiaceae bacterium]